MEREIKTHVVLQIQDVNKHNKPLFILQHSSWVSYNTVADTPLQIAKGHVFFVSTSQFDFILVTGFGWFSLLSSVFSICVSFLMWPVRSCTCVACSILCSLKSKWYWLLTLIILSLTSSLEVFCLSDCSPVYWTLPSELKTLHLCQFSELNSSNVVFKSSKCFGLLKSSFTKRLVLLSAVFI